MIKFSCSDDKYTNDLMELIRAFEQRVNDDFSLFVEYENLNGLFKVNLSSDKLDGFKKTCRYSFESSDDMAVKRLEKRYLKEAIYSTIVFLTGVSLPYGCLTGIRPTKLYFGLGEQAYEKFSGEFSVSEKKVKLIDSTVKTQQPYRNRDGGYDLFVFIPFCPTLCSYCSFVSVPIDKQKKLVEPYVDCLLQELELIKDIVRIHKISLRAIYVGGGTPTSLPTDLLERILISLKDFTADEYTVEAGRPDTMSLSVLRMLKSYGVNRISVNPQTFNDKTLKLIGRKHTVDEVKKAYARAKKLFDVNMDLIAMLPNESIDDFKYSLDTAVSLSPDNITVHTLYLKKGSELKTEGYRHTSHEIGASMVDYAFDKLTASGYSPYYMYRQKYTGGNLENVGYAKEGKVCIYNVDIMEEDTSILAAGAAAISKKWTESTNLIERNANFKEPSEYVKRFDEVIARQKMFWSI